ncbi:alpha/beta hydrolase [Pseudonocardia acidicola]|uniref:Alpha/beta hydrolase n=1 Tax=Pseudonocardia acidicola TaxID=2724939 RepID=A0ABX1S8D0_9PSEU|nr:alpha/beta hydrolase [Pseudonocardia acidicola]NMH96418.1 alpha/beta hydrolase [Pseudonocardia acidicola]
MRLTAAVGNVRDKVIRGGLADLTRMPRTAVATGPDGALYRYHPQVGAPAGGGPPVLLVPPLGAPDFAYDLRRGCSLVEHLLSAGRTVYLVDYGPISFAERGLGMEHWVDGVVPDAVRRVADETGSDVQLVAWSLGGIFALLAVAAAADAGEPLPVRTVTAVGSPVDISAVPLVAPLRPLAIVTGGRGLSAVYQLVGSFPAPVVSWAFHLTAVDKLITKPLTLLSRLDDRDCLAQMEAVDHLMNNMHGYPGRVFGQIYHLLLRNNDLADGTLALARRTIPLAAVDVPVLVVAGRNDLIAPLRAVQRVVGLLTGAPEVRFETAPGGHLGVLTGRNARTTTWAHLDTFLDDYRH